MEKDDEESSRMPLSLATQFGHVEVIQELLKHGAHANATRKGVYTTLHRVVDQNENAVLEAVIDPGVELNAAHSHRGTNFSKQRTPR